MMITTSDLEELTKVGLKGGKKMITKSKQPNQLKQPKQMKQTNQPKQPKQAKQPQPTKKWSPKDVPWRQFDLEEVERAVKAAEMGLVRRPSDIAMPKSEIARLKAEAARAKTTTPAPRPKPVEKKPLEKPLRRPGMEGMEDLEAILSPMEKARQRRASRSIRRK